MGRGLFVFFFFLISNAQGCGSLFFCFFCSFYLTFFRLGIRWRGNLVEFRKWGEILQKMWGKILQVSFAGVFGCGTGLQRLFWGGSFVRFFFSFKFFSEFLILRNNFLK